MKKYIIIIFVIILLGVGFYYLGINKQVINNNEGMDEFNEGDTLETETIETLPEAENDLTLGTVKIGEMKYINGVNITLHSVVGDYRCPIDVTCIQGGAITANVTLKSESYEETKNMASDEAPMPFDTFHISIVEINPPLLSTEPADPNAYVLTFKVTAN